MTIHPPPPPGHIPPRTRLRSQLRPQGLDSRIPTPDARQYKGQMGTATLGRLVSNHPKVHHARATVIRCVSSISLVALVALTLASPVGASQETPLVSPAGPDEAPAPPPDVRGASTPAAYLAEAYGLSAEEAGRHLALMPDKRRLALQARALRGFAGFWTDHADGGTIHVAVTQAPEQVAQLLASTFESAELLRVHAYPHSFAYLKEVYETVEQDRSTLGEELATRFYGSYILESANLVKVFVDSNVESVQAALDERFGAGVTSVEIGTASVAECRGSRRARDLCPSPYRGGVTMQNITRPGLCTQGYNARNAIGNFYVLTAGHCGAVGDVFSHNFQDVGYVAGRRDGPDGRTDVMRILETNGNYSSNSRWLVDETTSDAFQVRDRALIGEYSAGDVVCISGIMTLKNCGEITSISGSGGGENTRNTNQLVTRICREAGDSGAPIYDDNSRGDQTGDGIIEGTAVGIHNGSGPELIRCNAVHTHVRNAEVDLEVFIITR